MAVFRLGPIFIEANSRFTQFWHGWEDNQAVAFSVVVSGGSAPGVLNPLGRVTFTADETLRHVTGKTGRFIVIQNKAPFNPAIVHILAQTQSI
jgi:hypothetical protein